LSPVVSSVLADFFPDALVPFLAAVLPAVLRVCFAPAELLSAAVGCLPSASAAATASESGAADDWADWVWAPPEDAAELERRVAVSAAATYALSRRSIRAGRGRETSAARGR